MTPRIRYWLWRVYYRVESLWFYVTHHGCLPPRKGWFRMRPLAKRSQLTWVLGYWRYK